MCLFSLFQLVRAPSDSTQANRLFTNKILTIGVKGVYKCVCEITVVLNCVIEMWSKTLLELKNMRNQCTLFRTFHRSIQKSYVTWVLGKFSLTFIFFVSVHETSALIVHCFCYLSSSFMKSCCHLLLHFLLLRSLDIDYSYCILSYYGAEHFLSPSALRTL